MQGIGVSQLLILKIFLEMENLYLNQLETSFSAVVFLYFVAGSFMLEYTIKHNVMREDVE
jgi:hypothetical protein